MFVASIYVWQRDIFENGVIYDFKIKLPSTIHSQVYILVNVFMFTNAYYTWKYYVFTIKNVRITCNLLHKSIKNKILKDLILDHSRSFIENSNINLDSFKCRIHFDIKMYQIWYYAVHKKAKKNKIDNNVVIYICKIIF